jgi:pyrroline-5-carboxylate reductase
MVIGFCGSGSMAAAMARGWGADAAGTLFTDSGSGRGAQLAAEVGGEALKSNAELARRADAVLLAVKPAMLAEVAAEMGEATAVVSLLGATPLASVEAAFPGAKVGRLMPNVAVEVRRGTLCLAGSVPDELRRMLGLLGTIVELDDALFDAATAVMGCSPAYLALAVEALADAGAEAGLDRDLALELVVAAAQGTAELLGERPPAEVRHTVASPGGSTEAGLEALDREGAAAAFEAAVRASLERMGGTS